jgi:hypothetical protein
MMKDYRTHLETLRKQAAESESISSLATDPQSDCREAYSTLKQLAGEVERAMAAAQRQPALQSPGLNRTDPRHD